MQRTDSSEKTLMLGKVESGRRRNDRGWDGWMASPTQWTWVWVNTRSWWWTGRPGVLQSMGSQRVLHSWVTELNSWFYLCLSYMAFIMLKYIFLYTNFIESFYHKWWFCITLIYLNMFYHSWIPGINLTWLWCMILVKYWISFANILLSIFVPLFIRNIHLYFSCFMIPLSGFDVRVMLALQNEFGIIPSCSMAWKIQEW